MPNLKTVIIQTVLPRYLTPLFERISRLKGIDLTVLADLKIVKRNNHVCRDLTDNGLGDGAEIKQKTFRLLEMRDLGG